MLILLTGEHFVDWAWLLSFGSVGLSHDVAAAPLVLQLHESVHAHIQVEALKQIVLFEILTWLRVERLDLLADTGLEMALVALGKLEVQAVEVARLLHDGLVVCLLVELLEVRVKSLVDLLEVRGLLWLLGKRLQKL